MICADCGEKKRIHARGLCSTCYSRWNRTKNPEAARRTRERTAEWKRKKRRELGMKEQRKQVEFCTHESGCQEPTEARDLCKKHYRAWWREENREKRAEYNRTWQKNRREQIRASRPKKEKKPPAPKKTRKRTPKPKVSLKKKQITTNESLADYMRRIRREFGIAG